MAVPLLRRTMQRSTPEIDELTLARARRGDDAACRAVFRHYQRAVYCLAWRMLGGRANPALVEDLTQETFLTSSRSRMQPRPPRPARRPGAVTPCWGARFATRSGPPPRSKRSGTASRSTSGSRRTASSSSARTRCCRARLPRALYDEHERELQSSVGLGGGEDESALLFGDDEAGMIAERICFRRTDGRDPDRGAERDALLSTIRPELASCARGLTHEVVISIELTLDESGAITKADTRSDPTGEPAAACVERAVVGAAAFAPASEASRLPVNVTLPPR
jgi:hypothetical protein